MQIWFLILKGRLKYAPKYLTKIKLDVRSCEIRNMEQTLGSFSEVTFSHFLRGKTIVVESPFFSPLPPSTDAPDKAGEGRENKNRLFSKTCGSEI